MTRIREFQKQSKICLKETRSNAMDTQLKVGDLVVHRKGNLFPGHSGKGKIVHVDQGGDSVLVLWEEYLEPDFQWSCKLFLIKEVS